MNRDDKCNSIFQKTWWLDAVAPGSWKEVTVEKGGQLVAGLPYVLDERKGGLKQIRMPQLTQTLGPWYVDNGGKETAKLAFQKKVFTDLIVQLPASDYFSQNFHYSITNWQPFYWQGFNQTTYYTYVVEDLSDLDAVLRNFKSEKRGDIKKAGNVVSVEFGLSAQQFYDHHSSSLSKLGQTISYSRELFNRIHDGAVANNAGTTLYAIDSSGAIHAALFIVWSTDSAYLLISSVDPEYRDSSSLSLLIWEAMKHCADKTKRFDFEGSMIESVESSYRAFGGSQKPYFVISKQSKKMRRMQLVNSVKSEMMGLLSKS